MHKTKKQQAQGKPASWASTQQQILADFVINFMVFQCYTGSFIIPTCSVVEIVCSPHNSQSVIKSYLHHRPLTMIITLIGRQLLRLRSV